MLVKTLIFIFISVPFKVLNAQNHFNQFVTLEYGINHLERQDLIFSPFVYSGLSTANFKFKYQREKDLYQVISFEYKDFSGVHTKPYNYRLDRERRSIIPSTFSFVEIYYQIGSRLFKNSRIKVFAGATSFSDVQLLNYAYGQFVQFGYYSSIGIGGFGHIQYHPNENYMLSASLKFSILSWISRSPYAISDDKFIASTSSHQLLKTFFSLVGNGRLTSWNELQKADFQFGYLHRVGKNWSLGLNYRFSFVHTAYPRNLLSFWNGVQINTGYQF